MNKPMAFLALIAFLLAITVIDPGFSRGALLMLLGAVSLSGAEWLIELWRKG